MLWPFMLWGLAIVPFLLGIYIRLRGRNHWPALLMLIGLILLLLAMTRPRAILLLPSRLETVMLAIDSSGSMRANDAQPSRIELAQSTAKAIVDEQPAFVKLGIVSVAGTAALVQAPTDKREDLKRAIDNLPLQRGSALGSGIVIALSSMLPNAGLDVDKLINPEEAARAANNPSATKPSSSATPKVKLEPGSNTSAVIVLMSDGQSNMGPDTIEMARVAADLGVRIFTIGFGTPEGTVLHAHGVSVRVKLDEAPLKRIAEITHGEYFRAASPTEIKKIYQSLGMRIVMQKHQLAEITAILLTLGMGLVLLASAWSIARTGRVI
jgi:Ca-activated chloride channel family protein